MITRLSQKNGLIQMPIEKCGSFKPIANVIECKLLLAILGYDNIQVQRDILRKLVHSS